MSKPWAIADQTGLVSRIFTGSEEDAALQCAPGESAVDASDLSASVPDWENAVWSGRSLVFQSGGFALQDRRPLQDLKAAKNAEINAARLAANQTSFTFQGKAIACDALSRGDIEGVNGLVALTGALPPGFPGGWKAADNSVVAIPNVQVWAQFYGAMVAQGTANFNKSQALKAQLDLAQTAAEVEAISWNTNA